MLAGTVFRLTTQKCSVLNGPGPPQGPAGGPPRALDGTGRQKAVCSRPGNLGTAVIVNDSGPYNVRQIGVGERAGLPGTAGQSFCSIQLFRLLD